MVVQYSIEACTRASLQLQSDTQKPRVLHAIETGAVFKPGTDYWMCANPDTNLRNVLRDKRVASTLVVLWAMTATVDAVRTTGGCGRTG